MLTASLTKDLDFNADRPAIKVLLETSYSKEIRILLKADQVMKEHKTSFPIIVEIVSGEIFFTVNSEKRNLKQGDLIALEGNVPHSLEAQEDSIIRLSLTKSDSTERVQKVAEA
jgi:quercetin dioxygenase-like cupin family protein